MILKKFKQHCLLGAVATLPLLLDSAETMQRKSDGKNQPAKSRGAESRQTTSSEKNQSVWDEMALFFDSIVTKYGEHPDSQTASGQIILAKLKNLQYIANHEFPVREGAFNELASKVDSNVTKIKGWFIGYIGHMITVLNEVEPSTQVLMEKYPWLWSLFEETILSTQRGFASAEDNVRLWITQCVFELMPYLKDSSNETVEHTLKANVKKLVTFFSEQNLTENTLVGLASAWRGLTNLGCDLSCKLFLTSEIRKLEINTGYEWNQIYSALIGLMKVFSLDQQVNQQNVLTTFGELQKLVPAIRHRLAADSAMFDIVFSFKDVIGLLPVIKVPFEPRAIGSVYGRLFDHLQSLIQFLADPKNKETLINGLIDPSPSNLVDLLVAYYRVISEHEIPSWLNATDRSVTDECLNMMLEIANTKSGRVRACATKLSVKEETMRKTITDYHDETGQPTGTILSAVEILAAAGCDPYKNNIELCISLEERLHRKGLKKSIFQNLKQLGLVVTATQYWDTHSRVAIYEDEIQNHTATIRELARQSAVKK